MSKPLVSPLSALDLARRVEAGAITPAGVVDLCVEAIAAKEAEIGAFAAVDPERTRARAEAAVAALTASPLRGLPVGVKDIFDTADMPTGYGSPIYAGHRPATDAALVSMVRRTGGLVLGKTVTTQFAFMDAGDTRNPHDPDHTPGGSSSGSAAAVAAGMLPVAIGTQTGGSVVRPGAYCGVAAYKPSYRMLPMVGCKCFSWSLDTAGLFAAGIADVAFAAAALAGRDLRVDRAAPSAPRIGLARTHIWPEASPAMQAAVERAARLAEAAGATVRDVTLPPVFEDAFRAHAAIQDHEAVRALAFEYDQHRDRLGPQLRAHLTASADIPPEAYDDARRIAKRARHALADLMTEVDVLLTPSAPGAAPRGLGSTGQSIFNRLWTLMGTPCINVPGMFDESGLPLGVQVVGRFGRDRAALEAALFVERALASPAGA
ncbi:amidase [Rhodoplanes sp. TEM]|uniref:Amidase n=1 Tax=Rhodoplanes tepidamans TaxID=200616 RepID=A0ABT5J7F8_RHOTP|nr:MULTISPECIES: amidase [Rhodoplanes]MDC7785407.1 amidase [Rhodoplanes tepidamans]MDC7986964.1 amidase [Rhodoplanes sp. TEM]MDQ0353140.1 Asp-tRNA(Asn)/Glu-tRNA(Gln) amidotransferase A subunit family amidase [Rhodoplanes tepidamans]